MRARAVAGGSVPIAASVSFDPFGTMADGTGPEQMAHKLAAWGASALGVNCADGPAGVYEMVTRMLGGGLPVIAQPNAGLPHRVDGRFAYMATPEYFQLYARRLYKAGVKAVGGCCGTTAEHVRKIKSAARMTGASSGDETGGGMRDDDAPRIEVAPGIVVTPRSEKGAARAPRSANSSWSRWRSIRRLGYRWIRRSTARACCATAASTWSTSQTGRAQARAWATWRCACASSASSRCPR